METVKSKCFPLLLLLVLSWFQFGEIKGNEKQSYKERLYLISQVLKDNRTSSFDLLRSKVEKPGIDLFGSFLNLDPHINLLASIGYQFRSIPIYSFEKLFIWFCSLLQ